VVIVVVVTANCPNALGADGIDTEQQVVAGADVGAADMLPAGRATARCSLCHLIARQQADGNDQCQRDAGDEPDLVTLHYCTSISIVPHHVNYGNGGSYLVPANGWRDCCYYIKMLTACQI